MKNDLKKKFLDILFEPEEESEVVVEEELKEVRGLRTTPVKEERRETVKPNRTPETTKRVVTSNSFINLDKVEDKKEEIKTKEVNVDLSDTYELKHHISPIFGNIETKTTKKEEIVKKPSVSVSIPNNKDYTGIVLSPIFGYDNTSAEKARVDFMKNKKKDSALLTKNIYENEEVKEVKLHEETISLFDEPFDEPEISEEVFNEPFTSEIKVIDIEGEPIEEVKEEYEEEAIKSYELDDLDELTSFEDEDIKEDTSKVTYSSNARSFIDDLLGDKD